MVSTKKDSRSGHSIFLHIISRNHSKTFLLINLQKKKPCTIKNIAVRAIYSNIRILTGLDRSLSISYLCSNDLQITGGYIYQVVSGEFHFAALVQKKDRPLKNISFYSNNKLSNISCQMVCKIFFCSGIPLFRKGGREKKKKTGNYEA